MNAPLEMTREQAAPAFDTNLFPGEAGGMGPLFEALALAQGEFQPIEKNKSANIRPRDPGKSSYSFDYADMGEIRAKTTPALAKNKLAIVSLPTARGKSDGGHVLRTMITHASGARIESILVIPQQQEVRNFGGYITYLRRYVVSAMLNIAADSDLDDQDDHGEDERSTPTAGSRAATHSHGNAPNNPAEHPGLASAVSISALNKVWMNLPAESKAKFEAHYNRRMDELDVPPEGLGNSSEGGPAPTPVPAAPERQKAAAEVSRMRGNRGGIAETDGTGSGF